MTINSTKIEKVFEWIDRLANLSALGGIALSIYVAYYGISDSTLKLVFYYLCGLVTLFVGMNFWFGFQLHKLSLANQTLAQSSSEARKKTEKLLRLEIRATRLFGEIASTFEAFEGFMGNFQKDVAKVAHGTSKDRDDKNNVLHEKFRMHSIQTFQKIMDKTSDLFSVLSGQRSAACIKLRSQQEIKGSTGLGEIYTFLRDSHSHDHRNYDRTGPLSSYPCAENSAFKFVLESQESDFYACDDLLNQPHYQNMNGRWRDLYNAVAVHAVRRPNTPKNENKEVIAFVCIDNKRGNLDRPLIQEILAIYSWHMYTFLGHLVDTHRLLTKEGELRHEFASKTKD